MTTRPGDSGVPLWSPLFARERWKISDISALVFKNGFYIYIYIYKGGKGLSGMGYEGTSKERFVI